MKIFNMTLALAFSLTLAAGMGAKSKPVTPIDEPKVLPESTRASAPMNAPVALIENTVEDNQKVEKGLDKSTAQSDGSTNSKKATKTKAPAAKKKKAAPAKKATSKSKSAQIK